jgi:hypothetical protein
MLAGWNTVRAAQDAYDEERDAREGLLGEQLLELKVARLELVGLRRAWG